jgi:hypothetical protein
MDLKAVCNKVATNQLTYDEALRVSSYIEKVSNLLNIQVNFNFENFLNKSLDLNLTPEDALNLEKVLTYMIKKHEEYQNKMDTKNQKFRQYEDFQEEDFRPRRKKNKYR